MSLFTPFLAFGMPGPFEMAIIGGAMLLIFGNRLPSVARSLGKGITEFKNGINGIGDDIDTKVTADAKPVVTPPTVVTTPVQDA